MHGTLALLLHVACCMLHVAYCSCTLQRVQEAYDTLESESSRSEMLKRVMGDVTADIKLVNAEFTQACWPLRSVRSGCSGCTSCTCASPRRH